MSEIKDMVVPMLQKLQQDMATNFKWIDAKVTSISETVLETKEEVEAVKGYITYQMGLTSQHQTLIDAMRKEMADLKRRVSALESRS
jgi:hypothetical protein